MPIRFIKKGVAVLCVLIGSRIIVIVIILNTLINIIVIILNNVNIIFIILNNFTGLITCLGFINMHIRSIVTIGGPNIVIVSILNTLSFVVVGIICLSSGIDVCISMVSVGTTSGNKI